MHATNFNATFEIKTVVCKVRLAGDPRTSQTISLTLGFASPSEPRGRAPRGPPLFSAFSFGRLRGYANASEPRTPRAPPLCLLFSDLDVYVAVRERISI